MNLNQDSPRSTSGIAKVIGVVVIGSVLLPMYSFLLTADQFDATRDLAGESQSPGVHEG